MNIRQEIEKREVQYLHPRAALSIKSRGRRVKEEEGDIRTCYQRDRDRVVHCKSFRRLKHKTQVFLANRGDHYRTRLTHVVEVSQISRTIARALRLNEDLTEAIALAHDLGHTPFGHAGEDVLREIHPGGFEHYRQSLRIVDFLEKDGKGLNLTHEVRNGIITHSKGMGSIFPNCAHDKAKTLEGQIVRISDVIAYVNHDLDDALRAGFVKQSDIPVNITKVVGDRHSVRIDTMVKDLVYTSLKTDLECIKMTDDVYDAICQLREFLYKMVYNSEVMVAEFKKAKKILKVLYEHYLENSDQIVGEFPKDVRADKHRIVCDFIAGMTDRFAVMAFEKICLPGNWPNNWPGN